MNVFYEQTGTSKVLPVPGAGGDVPVDAGAIGPEFPTEGGQNSADVPGAQGGRAAARRAGRVDVHGPAGQSHP